MFVHVYDNISRLCPLLQFSLSSLTVRPETSPLRVLNYCLLKSIFTSLRILTYYTSPLTYLY